MKRAIFGMSSAGLVASFMALAASCGPPPEPVKVVAPVPLVTASAPPATASSTAPAAPAVDLNNPADIDIAAWTDDDAVKALAKDCHWDPGGCVKALEVIAPQSIDTIDYFQENAPPSSDTRPLPPGVCINLVRLACARVPGQSCVQDECSQSDYDCFPACDKACTGCASTCVTGCETCKSACKDDACRLTCAKSCGECRQSCLKALDHCTSAECSEKEEACFKTRDDEWTKSACPKVCPKVQACIERCPSIPNDYTGELYRSPCANRCMSTLGKGCPASFDRFCKGDSNASVNFYSYHGAHHPDGP